MMGDDHRLQYEEWRVGPACVGIHDIEGIYYGMYQDLTMSQRDDSSRSAYGAR